MNNLFHRLTFFLGVLIVLLPTQLSSQIVINEGSNRNFQTVVDEDGDSKDWIELYNAGEEVVDLFEYQLTTIVDDPEAWTFPHYSLDAGEHLLVFCSDKNRFFSEPFQQVAYETDYTPNAGWNTHDFSSSFLWDGVSDIVVNSCSYSDEGYTTNSVFNQSQTAYISSVHANNDGNDASCNDNNGETHQIRPNIKLNDVTIGTGTETNCNTCYPAPYGNWYWSARNQSLYPASELIAAGLTAGTIESIAWDVNDTDNALYTYIEISLKQMVVEELSVQFINNNGTFFHTDFKINSEGEVVYLLSPEGNVIDELNVNVPVMNASVGLFIDGVEPALLLQSTSPGSSNNDSQPALGVATAPVLSVESGVYSSLQNVSITDLNDGNSEVYYTLNGEEPTESSTLYEDEIIPVFQSLVIRAKAFSSDKLPSEISAESYLINVDHSTPIVSVIVDPDHLFGDAGIFDNWEQDWERYAQMMYFDSSATHPLLFERQSAMQIDGGAGGSRAHPQHSFRLELAKGSLNESPVELPLLTHRPEREKYSKLYFRNGSNQWLTMPWKDGCQVEMMAGGLNAYFSAERPVSVYINGAYFGVYEMREKLDCENFEVYDGAIPTDVITLSAWYNFELRATQGDPQNYWDSVEEFSELDPLDPDFLEQADAIYDMEYYADYIIGETWMGNADWPQNNIKIHRSDSTNNRWRFSTIDLELSLAPNGWTDCNFNGLEYAHDHGENQPFIGPWIRSMNNPVYREYFINRYADILNTSYRIERLLEISDTYFNQWALEMPNEYQRWGDPWNVNEQMLELYDNHLIFQDELVCKSETVRDQIEDQYDLDGQFTLTLDVLPAGAGYIEINTIAPQDLPWDGIYYNGVPIELKAVAYEGYTFEYWIDNGQIGDVINTSWNGAIDLNEIEFVAVFEQFVGITEIVATTTRLYPNPASSILQLENDQHRIKGYSLFNMDGRIVQSNELNLSQHRLSIDISGFASGIYAIQVTYLDGNREILRWMKN